MQTIGSLSFPFGREMVSLWKRNADTSDTKEGSVFTSRESNVYASKTRTDEARLGSCHGKTPERIYVCCIVSISTMLALAARRSSVCKTYSTAKKETKPTKRTHNKMDTIFFID